MRLIGTLIKDSQKMRNEAENCCKTFMGTIIKNKEKKNMKNRFFKDNQVVFKSFSKLYSFPPSVVLSKMCTLRMKITIVQVEDKSSTSEMITLSFQVSQTASHSRNSCSSKGL